MMTNTIAEVFSQSGRVAVFSLPRSLSKHARHTTKNCGAGGLTLFHPEITSGRNRTNMTVHRVRIGNMPPKKEPDMPGGICSRIDGSSGKKRFHLRGRSKGVPVV